MDKHLQDHKDALEREQSLENKLKDKEKHIIKLDAKIISIKGPNGGAEDMIEQIKQLQESRRNLKKDLDDGTKMIVQMEEKLKAAYVKSIELLKTNADTGKENKKLNIYLKDLRKRVPGEIYVPMKHDPIDQKLCKFLNASSGGMEPTFSRTLFRREGEGIYMFGTKKIYLKLLNDNIMVRIGGGYQALDEFVKYHGEEEMNRIQREENRATLFELPAQ